MVKIKTIGLIAKNWIFGGGLQFLRFILELGRNAAKIVGACVLYICLSLSLLLCLGMHVCVCVRVYPFVSAVIAVTVVVVVVTAFHSTEKYDK